MQPHEAYKALPAKVSQHILMLLGKNWTSFKEAREAYEENPSTFTGRPRLPKYMHKTEGRNIQVYTIICADVNGAYNILRKSKLDAGAKGIAAYVV